jgi:hypothetical protein
MTKLWNSQYTALSFYLTVSAAWYDDKLDSIWWEVVVAYSRHSLETAEYNHIAAMLTCSLDILRQEMRPASHLMPTYTSDMGSGMATGSWTKNELAWIPHIRCRTKTAT